MRVLFTTWAWSSHLFPFVPMAWACRAAGHDVRVAGMPALSAAMRETGLAAVPVGPDVELAGMSNSGGLAEWHRQERWPADWPARPDRLSAKQRGLLATLGAKQCHIAEQMLDDVIAFGRHWKPDLVVSDVSTFAGPVAAAVLGVPSVFHLWGSPGVLRYEHLDLGEEPLPEYEALFARRGLDTAVAPAAWLDTCPPSMNLPAAVRRLPMRFVPYNGAGADTAWREPAGGAPRVLVTWGVTAAKVLGAGALEPLRHICDAVLSLGAEPVLAVTSAQRPLLPELPGGVQVVESAPLQLLLPTCAAIVHQGGAGTALTAAVYGVPQLSVGQRPAPVLLGDRLAAVGAGRSLMHQDLLDAADVTELLREELRPLLTDPAYAVAAAALAAEIEAQPSPADLVGELVAIAEAVPAVV